MPLEAELHQRAKVRREIHTSADASIPTHIQMAVRVTDRLRESGPCVKSKSVELLCVADASAEDPNGKESERLHETNSFY